VKAQTGACEAAGSSGSIRAGPMGQITVSLKWMTSSRPCAIIDTAAVCVSSSSGRTVAAEASSRSTQRPVPYRFGTDWTAGQSRRCSSAGRARCGSPRPLATSQLNSSRSTPTSSPKCPPAPAERCSHRLSWIAVSHPSLTSSARPTRSTYRAAALAAPISAGEVSSAALPPTQSASATAISCALEPDGQATMTSSYGSTGRTGSALLTSITG
jgi:hypothetical protein